MAAMADKVVDPLAGVRSGGAQRDPSPPRARLAVEERSFVRLRSLHDHPRARPAWSVRVRPDPIPPGEPRSLGVTLAPQTTSRQKQRKRRHSRHCTAATSRGGAPRRQVRGSQRHQAAPGGSLLRGVRMGNKAPTKAEVSLPPSPPPPYTAPQPPSSLHTGLSSYCGSQLNPLL